MRWAVPLGGILCAVPVQADWILIEDFEDFAVGTYTEGGDPGLPYPVASCAGQGLMDVVTGIEGISGEKAGFFYSWIAQDAFHQIPLPGEIPINGRGTLFFRIWHEIPETALNWYVMISKVAAGAEPVCSPPFPNQSAILRYFGDGDDKSLLAHEYDGEYLRPEPPFAPEPEGWHAYWIVLDNAYDTIIQSGDAGYSIYRKGPDDVSPRLMFWGQDDPRSKLPFRNQALASLKAIVIWYWGQNTWLIDDLYMTHGTGLSDPVTGERYPTWCAYPIIDGHVESVDWLGWLYAAEAPWVYSYELDTWLYVPDCPDRSGGWVFVSRPESS